GGRVVGTAVDVHGMPLTSAQVLCSGDRGGRNRSRFTVTDSQGAFEILGLREGSYSVRLVSGRRDFFARENSPSSAAVTLAEGETREVYLQETPSSGVTVKGRITYNGVPLKSGFMTATADAGGAPAFSSIYNDGTYALDDVTAGENRFTVRFGDAGDMESVTLRFHIPEQDEVSLDMDLPDARIQGRVTDGVTGMALQGVNLSISSESDDDSSMQGWFRNRKTATTGIDGSYTFKMLSPGTYRIRAESSGSADVEGKAVGYYPAEVNAIRIIENQNLQNLNIALYMGGGIEVQVFQENGLPLDRATVIAVPTEEEDAALPTQSSRERTDAEGVALIEPIEPGDYTLTVQARNMGQAIKEGIRVSAGAVQKVSVSLTAGFTISIRLKDTTGAPIEEARLTLRDAQNRKLSLPPTRMGRGGFFGSGGQEEAGLYRLGSLVPGAYSIEASWGDRTGVAEFNVSRDAELSLVPR
ncbi:MAG: carboxypeptidase-like regulatory domain-containing protein, partial [Planctomycetota bacterium]